MLPGVPPRCWLAARGLPENGFASGRKYLNSRDGSASATDLVPLHPNHALGLAGTERGELLPSAVSRAALEQLRVLVHGPLGPA